MKIHQTYQNLENARSIKLEKARLYAAATKPMLMPKSDSDVRSNRQVVHPHSSLPARGVTEFGAKITSGMLPPSGTPFLAMEIPPSIQANATKEQLETLRDISKKVQDVVHNELLMSNVRDVWNVAIEHIAVIGDVVIRQDGMTFSYFRLDNFGVKRDVTGNPIELVVRQWMREEELDDQQKKQLKEDNIEVVRRFDSNFYPYYIHVEFLNNKNQKETHYLGNTEVKQMNHSQQVWTVPQYKQNAYEDYSNSLVEENYGDIVAAHALRETLLEAMAVGNIGYIGFVPGSITADTLKQTPNWGVLPIKDQSTLQFIQPNTVATISTTAAFAEKHDQEIRRIFLMDVASELTHDRTTAYQVNQAIAALERATGPMLNLLRSTMLEPAAMNTINHLIKTKKLGPEVKQAINDGQLQLVIKSGVNSMDADSENQKILTWASTWFQVAPEQALQKIDINALLEYSAQLTGIPSQLLNSREQMAANAEQQQQQQLQEALIQQAPQASQTILEKTLEQRGN